MPQYSVTLSTTPVLVPIDAPAGRIVVTMWSSPAPVFGTADGSLPVVPSNVTEVPGSQRALAAVIGQQMVLDSPQYGDHMANATVRLVSSGTPTVLVSW